LIFFIIGGEAFGQGGGASSQVACQGGKETRQEGSQRAIVG